LIKVQDFVKVSCADPPEIYGLSFILSKDGNPCTEGFQD